MTKITLDNVGSLLDYTTAQTTINDNFDTIQTAMDNTLSRDGTSPNTMSDTLDMNSNQIINLPTPGSNYSPLRLIDAATLNGGGTISVSPLPTGGTTGQVLAKNSATNFDVGWQSTHYLPAGGLTGQNLVKTSGTDYAVAWQTATTSIGGSANSVQYNNGAGGFAGLSLSPAQVVSGGSTIPVAVYPSVIDVVNGFGIDNTGATNVATALQTAITTITGVNSTVYIPAGTYNMGSGSLNIPSYATIICHPNAVLRRTADPSYADYTSSMVYWTGTQVTWLGGVLDNNVVMGTSTTSNTVNGSNKTWTTQAGLPIIPGSTFLRVWSASHPEAHFEGVASAYSGTTLTINSPFNSGSGTYTDWNIGIGSTTQTAMTLHGATKSLVEGVRCTGNWYIGLMLDGWNPPAGGPLNCQFNIFRRCFVDGVQNRGFYYYGTCWDNIIEDCSCNGSNLFSGCTDYGFNFNPANASGSINTQLRNKIMGCRADNCGFQGFALSDQCIYCQISDCSSSNGTNAASSGFLIQYANGLSPQYCQISNCIAHNIVNIGFQIVGCLYCKVTSCLAVVCGTGYTVGPSVAQAQYISLGDCQAVSNTVNGIVVFGNSVRTNLGDCVAVNNSNIGISITASANITTVTGCRAFGNLTNYSDAGTGTVGTPTTT